MISKENELLAWEHITTKAQDALDLFSSTLEDDEEELQDIQKDKALNRVGKVNTRKCILHRINQKKVLYFFKQCAEKVQQLFKMTWEEAVKEVDSWKEMDNNNLEYFKQTVLPLLKKHEEQLKEAEKEEKD